jgi:RNA polymerase sigma-70 factor (ECF subfamily)
MGQKDPQSIVMDTEKEFLDLMKENRKIVFKVVRMYAYTLADQKDLYQEIMLQAWKSFSRFKGEAKFSTWLYKVSLNTALTFRGSLQRHMHQSLEHTDIEKPDANPDQKEWLYVAIRQLPEAERGLICLHLDGYTNEEIGDLAGIKATHVAVKLFRIKQKLNTLLTNLEYGTARPLGSA